MKEGPILFSAPMVRAILEGRKTQTRRIVKPQPDGVWAKNPETGEGEVFKLLPLPNGDPWWNLGGINGLPKCPHGSPGSRLWVRESWRAAKWYDDLSPSDLPYQTIIEYGANAPTPDAGKLRPSIFMPRWASRINLELISVMVERLQDISDEDAIAEGIDPGWLIKTDNRAHNLLRSTIYGRYGERCGDTIVASEKHCFAWLWETINGHGSWEANPLVWRIEFKRV